MLPYLLVTFFCLFYSGYAKFVKFHGLRSCFAYKISYLQSYESQLIPPALQIEELLDSLFNDVLERLLKAFKLELGLLRTQEMTWPKETKWKLTKLKLTQTPLLPLLPPILVVAVNRTNYLAPHTPEDILRDVQPVLVLLVQEHLLCNRIFT